MDGTLGGDAYDGREDADAPELIEPEDFLAANPFPVDARRMGFDRYSNEGALIAFAASLDSARLGHRLLAWVWLSLLAAPLLLTVWFELRVA